MIFFLNIYLLVHPTNLWGMISVRPTDYTTVILTPPPPDTSVRRGFTGYVFHITPLLLGGFEPRSSVVTDQTDLSTIL
jgi:hypothetical protein